MLEPARIFIADIQDSQTLLFRVLEGYKLSTANTFPEAARMLAADGFDMIICGIHFDDSRMVDLLQAIFKDVRHKNTPVIVFHGAHSDNVDLLRTTVDTLRKLHSFGAYIELDNYLTEPGPGEALRKEIEKSIPKKLLAKRQS
jgi:CheY-like chemotaxis protein